MGSLKGGTKFEFDYIICAFPKQRTHYQLLLKTPTMRQGTALTSWSRERMHTAVRLYENNSLLVGGLRQGAGGGWGDVPSFSFSN